MVKLLKERRSLTRGRPEVGGSSVRARQRFGAAAPPVLDALAAGGDPSLQVLAAVL